MYLKKSANSISFLFFSFNNLFFFFPFSLQDNISHFLHVDFFSYQFYLTIFCRLSLLYQETVGVCIFYVLF